VLGETVKGRESLQEHRAKTVPVFSNSDAIIQRTAYLELHPGQQLVRWINRKVHACFTHTIATEIILVPEHSSIPVNEDAHCLANLAREASRDMVIKLRYTSASNRTTRFSEARSAAKTMWEAIKYSKHFSYRLKGKRGTKKPVSMTSMKSLATRFCRLKCRLAPTGVNLKQHGH
jgi:hypothetical protein